MAKFNVGDTVYLVESNRMIRLTLGSGTNVSNIVST